MCTQIVSISREFGSGGRLIGHQLAARLGIPCYDRTIIQRTAEKSGLSPEFIARAEERARSRFHLSAMNSGLEPAAGGTVFTQPQQVPVSHQAFFAQAEVIREMAEAGPCVIVGRCSDYVLEENPRLLKVFIHAPLADRVTRCAEEYGLPREDLEKYIRQQDRGRANYYSYFTGLTWGDMRRFDLTVSSSAAGIEGAAELIARLVQLRESCAPAEGT